MVLVSGCYNIMHAGHVELFKFATSFGSVTVGVNCDDYLVRKYGVEYTVPLLSRVAVLRSCRYVNDVVVFLEDDPGNLILHLQPKYFIRGPDYAGKELAEAQALYNVGAELIIHHAEKLHDSSALVRALPRQAFDVRGF